MQMWILKPPGFDPKKKWPVAFLVHGGPQGAWEDGWSYRWNPELWAAQGYVVALPNPRGTTGFGQKFVDEISGDWGGKCYEDLMKGVDYVEKLPYVDKDRMAAAGASFGGYMMNWFAVNTGTVQVADHALRRLELRQHVRHDRRTLVRRVGARRAAVGQEPQELREVLAAPVGRQPRQVQDADAGHPQRPRFPLPDRAGAGALHRFAAARRAVAVPEFPGRRSLGPEARQWQCWHQEVFGWITKYCPPGGR